MREFNLKHTPSTFRHTLSDFCEHHGVELNKKLQQRISRLVYRPELLVKPVCAVRYGQLGLFLLADHHPDPIRKIYLVEIPSGRICMMGQE